MSHKTHFRLVRNRHFKEGDSIQALCREIVPNAYFPAIFEPGNFPESPNTLLYCTNCWLMVHACHVKKKYLIYGLLENRAKDNVPGEDVA